MDRAMPLEERLALRQDLIDSRDDFIRDLPKVELHVHIEGTLTPELRWKLAQRNGQTLRLDRTNTVYNSLEQLRDSYGIIEPRPGHDVDNAEESFTFFEAYYGGFEVLVEERDFFDLAMGYFDKVAGMGVRWCELFFDPQGHTRRGVRWDAMMGGFRRAGMEAEERFGIKSSWIMCFLRDLSPESAMEHYHAMLPYRDMVIGIGLDSLEDDRPPCLFDEVFSLARKDGFRITAHCDINNKDTLRNIHQVASALGTTGADRIDHGLNAATSPDLTSLIKSRDVGMTVTPWGYLRHEPVDDIFPWIRRLFEQGIPLAIGSDDPAYMEDTWILHDWLLVKRLGRFGDGEMAEMARGAVRMSWADEHVKTRILEEIEDVVRRYAVE